MSETTRISTVERSKQNPQSLRLAINAHCFTCSGGSYSEVARCTVVKCSLHAHRPKWGPREFDKETDSSES